MKTPPPHPCRCPSCEDARLTAHETAGGLWLAFLAFLVLHVVGFGLVLLLPQP